MRSNLSDCSSKRLHKASVKRFDILDAGILGVTGTASVIVGINGHLVDILFLCNALERILLALII